MDVRAFPALLALSALFALSLTACDRETTHVRRHPDGTVKERWTEAAPEGSPALRHGRFRSFHPGGARESEVDYRRGRKHGEARIWDAQGRLVFRGRYRDDFLVRERRLDGGGRVVLDREYSLRTEKARTPGPAGDTLEAWETCAETQGDNNGGPGRHGLCRLAYPDGPSPGRGAVLSTRYYLQGRLHGPVEARHPDGSPWMEGAYAKGRPEGLWRAWDRDGKPIWSGRYAGGEREGTWKEWFPGGGPRSEARYRGGKREGPYQEWYPNGKPRLRAAYAEGRKEGGEKAWYPDGRPLWTARYAAGRLDGEFRQWYPGGGLRLQCRFREGRRHGPSRLWHRGGALSEMTAYAGGRLDGPYRSWTREGKPLAAKVFRSGEVARDSMASELLDLLGVDARPDDPRPGVPVGLAGFYWGMDRHECAAALDLMQAGERRSEPDGLSASLTAFPGRLPTPARLRLRFNAQGELWGIALDLRQGSAADYFPLCEALEAELGSGLGTAGMIKAGEGAPYRLERKRGWGSFAVTAGSPPAARRLPVLWAEAESPGAAGWFRFALSNNLYREYVNPANRSISPPAWGAEAVLAGR